MSDLYIMVGIPGSGKSTIAEKMASIDSNMVIISSDAIRKELYGDENFQGDNGKVFDFAHKKIKENLKKGFHVIFDATNVTIKGRKQIIRIGKEARADSIIAIVVAPIREICICLDKTRDRTVGAKVIDKFINRFELPFEQEGFDAIHFCSAFQNQKTRVDIQNEIFEADNGDFKQTGKYHLENLVEHCQRAMNDPDINLLSDNPILNRQMAFLHDYGKLFTRTKDETGYHFYNHGNVGAYHFISSVPTNADIYDIAKLMNYHDYAFLYSEKKLDEVFKDYADTLRIFRKIDERATIPNPAYIKTSATAVDQIQKGN